MSETHGRPLGRRRLLGTLGSATAVLAAGCAGDGANDDEGDGETGAGEDDGDDDYHDQEPVEHPIEEPMEFPDERLCEVCAMAVTDYPEWNGQLAHENGNGKFFDTPGCLFAYYVAPEHFDGPADSPVAGAWTTDFETGELIDATEAHFVLEHDEDRVDDPMVINPRPFENPDDATAYVEQYDDLDEDDVIVGLEEVDESTARIYRDRRLP